MNHGHSQTTGGPLGPLRARFNAMQTTLDTTARQYNLHSHLNHVARILVCLFFLNQAYSSLLVWYYYRQPFPVINVWLLPASLCVMANYRVAIFGSLLVLVALYDTGQIVTTQLGVWYNTGQLYINELMVKKFSLLGAAGLLLAQQWREDLKTNAMAGVLFAKATAMSSKKSLVVLLGRLLMSTLFLFVGYHEIKRQLDSVTVQNGHVHRARAAGDGHDQITFKLLEFVLSLPFLVGFKVNFIARCLAIVLILEAFMAWSWWTSTLNVGYVIHAREHFTVNVGTAGGILLLAFVGAGKYSVDELLKKKE